LYLPYYFFEKKDFKLLQIQSLCGISLHLVLLSVFEKKRVMDKNRQLALAIDVESSASRRMGVPRTLMSIGLACMELCKGHATQLVNSQRIVLNWEAEGGLVYDRDTAAWWAQFPTALRVSTTGGVVPTDAARQAQAFVDEVCTIAAKRQLPLIVVTDNAAFDLAWYDWLVCNYLPAEQGRPLSHDRELRFRGARRIVDLQQHLQAHRLASTGLTLTGHISTLMPRGTEKHDPLYDAIDLAEQYACYIQRMADLM
jgi:hypothetical protein